MSDGPAAARRRGDPEAGIPETKDGDEHDEQVDEVDAVDGLTGVEAETAAANSRADENWDKYLRAEAELDNYRRVAQRRLEETVERRRRALLESFLEVADNLERALSHSESEPEALLAGVEATYRALGQLLTREGVEAIEAMGEPFDPRFHEAMTVVHQPDLDTDRVIAVDRPGYRLGAEVLRPARVVVGRNTA